MNIARDLPPAAVKLVVTSITRNIGRAGHKTDEDISDGEPVLLLFATAMLKEKRGLPTGPSASVSQPKGPMFRAVKQFRKSRDQKIRYHNMEGRQYETIENALASPQHREDREE